MDVRVTTYKHTYMTYNIHTHAMVDCESCPALHACSVMMYDIMPLLLPCGRVEKRKRRKNCLYSSST